MAAITSITVTDGKGTPESHVFNPIASLPPTYRRNGVGVAAIAEERLLIQTVLSKNINGVDRVQIELVIPVSEVPAGGSSAGYTAPPAIAHEHRVKVEFFAHHRSTEAGRKDLRALLIGLLANAQVVAAVDKLEQPY